jgi:hypothetical protein
MYPVLQVTLKLAVIDRGRVFGTALMFCILVPGSILGAESVLSGRGFRVLLVFPGKCW